MSRGIQLQIILHVSVEANVLSSLLRLRMCIFYSLIPATEEKLRYSASNTTNTEEDKSMSVCSTKTRFRRRLIAKAFYDLHVQSAVKVFFQSMKSLNH
jgi:hypothetical protein